LALLGRLSWERVDGFVMQASEKPAQERTLQRLRREDVRCVPDRKLPLDLGRNGISSNLTLLALWGSKRA
jgi:hypothetical protein